MNPEIKHIFLYILFHVWPKINSHGGFLLVSFKKDAAPKIVCPEYFSDFHCLSVAPDMDWLLGSFLNFLGLVF